MNIKDLYVGTSNCDIPASIQALTPYIHIYMHAKATYIPLGWYVCSKSLCMNTHSCTEQQKYYKTQMNTL